MTVHKPGWAVSIKGDSADQEELRKYLAAQFDPWVEDCEWSEEAILLLRSAKWINVTDHMEIFQHGRRMVDLLNGMFLLLLADTKPLELRAVFKFNDSGGHDTFVQIEGAVLRASAGRVGVRVSGQPPSEPVESELQKWLSDADNDDNRAELFLHLRRADNWYDSYKVCELLGLIAGGENALQNAVGGEWAKFKRVRRTANYFRHAPGKVEKPNPLEEMGDAINFLRQLAVRLLNATRS